MIKIFLKKIIKKTFKIKNCFILFLINKIIIQLLVKNIFDKNLYFKYIYNFKNDNFRYFN